MKTKILLLILGTILSFSAFAKRDSTSSNQDFANSLFVSATNHVFPKVSSYTPWVNFRKLEWVPGMGNISDQFGISYQRKVYKDFGVSVNYTTWNTVPWLAVYTYPDGQEISDGPSQQQMVRGTIEYIQGYKMIDIYATYRYNKMRRHKINAGVGISYAWGINTVVDTIYVLAFDDEVIAHQQIAHYYGVAAFLSYDYLCLHNRLAIGYELKWRRYFGLYSPQIDYGIDIGFNF